MQIMSKMLQHQPLDSLDLAKPIHLLVLLLELLLYGGQLMVVQMKLHLKFKNVTQTLMKLKKIFGPELKEKKL